jgi:HAD superfamily hydrolase (TIGR01509 family)
MGALRGVILDVDGTLVDSNDAHARAWVEALAEHGIRVELERVRRLIGMGGDRLLPEVSGLAEDSPRGRAISKRRQEIFKTRYLPTLKPFPRTRDLLQRMHADGLKLAVASSARADELDPLLRLCGADGLVEKRTSSDDIDSSKPAPDAVEATLAELRLPAEAAIMLGDTPYDVESARRAGVGIIAVRCGGWGDADLAGALAIYDDPADLLARHDQSPLARRHAAGRS